MAEELSEKYLRAYSKTNKRNSYCPLYRNPPDVCFWADKFIQVPISQDTLGVYYAPAIRANNISSLTEGCVKETIDPAFVKDLSGSERTEDTFAVQKFNFSKYSYVDVSVTITVKTGYGAKSDGWCWNKTYLSIDGNHYDEWYTTRSNEGTKTHSWSKKKVLLEPGEHEIGIYTITNASSGDSAFFSCNNVSWDIANYGLKTKLSDMHCKIGETEYIFIENPGY